MEADDPPIGPEDRSDERGSYIIEALETDQTYRSFFNVRNNDVISNLPKDAIVEAPGYVDSNGIHVPAVGELPLACAATCMASVNVQRMATQAAATGDPLLLKQAMLHDPLVGAICDPPEVWQMVDELLVAQAEWLPQYRSEIPRARHRLKHEPRVKTKQWSGAARLPSQSLAQIRQTSPPHAPHSAADRSPGKQPQA